MNLLLREQNHGCVEDLLRSEISKQNNSRHLKLFSCSSLTAAVVATSRKTYALFPPVMGTETPLPPPAWLGHLDPHRISPGKKASAFTSAFQQRLESTQQSHSSSDYTRHHDLPRLCLGCAQHPAGCPGEKILVNLEEMRCSWSLPPCRAALEYKGR